MLHADEERAFGPDDGVDIGNVSAVHVRGPDVWIGGELSLQRLDHGRFRTLHALDEDALRGISGIVQTADGDLWLNGLGGIVHLPHDEIAKAINDPAYAMSADRFDRRVGLPGLPSQFRQMPTAIERTDGRLWFTVNNGVVWMDPKRASRTTSAPAVAIQSVFADDRLHKTGDSARFAAGTSTIRIVYSAVSLLNPEAVRFRHRLMGVEEGWHEAARTTSVTYHRLAPDAYRFEVGVTDSSGRWSERTASTAFTILPAFYQTAWFRLLCVLLALAVGWARYRLRVRQLRQRFDMTLDARVAERTRIARELHDTQLQSFQGLLLHLQTVFLLLPGRAPEAKDKLGGVIDQAADAIAEGRDAVQELRESTVRRNDLAREIGVLGRQLSQEATGRDSADVVLTVQGESPDLHPIVRDEIYKIAAEALCNASRHAGARRIDIELRYLDDAFELRVHNDGSGIDSAVLQGGIDGHYGLHGMHERAKLVGGKLALRSAIDEGTEVDLSVPASRAYARKRRWSWRREADTS